MIDLMRRSDAASTAISQRHQLLSTLIFFPLDEDSSFGKKPPDLDPKAIAA
jgi:hypothetical protein